MRIETSGRAVLMLVTMSAPSMAQTDQHGASHELDSPGRVTVVDFAASWCVPCWKSLPHLEALAQSHPDIQFLVVSVDDREDGRDQLVGRLGLSLPVIWDGGHAIAERFRPQGMPATYVLGADGALLHEHLGYDRDTWGAFVAFLDEL